MSVKNISLNSDIVSKCPSYCQNLDFLFKFINSKDFKLPYNTCYYTAVGFDFDEDNLIRQIQPLVGFDIFEVMQNCILGREIYGVHFNILHHDPNGFHYFVY